MATIASPVLAPTVPQPARLARNWPLEGLDPHCNSTARQRGGAEITRSPSSSARGNTHPPFHPETPAHRETTRGAHGANPRAHRRQTKPGPRPPAARRRGARPSTAKPIDWRCHGPRAATSPAARRDAPEGRHSTHGTQPPGLGGCNSTRVTQAPGPGGCNSTRVMQAPGAGGCNSTRATQAPGPESCHSTVEPPRRANFNLASLAGLTKSSPLTRSRGCTTWP